jgi:hypothetical protein
VRAGKRSKNQEKTGNKSTGSYCIEADELNSDINRFVFHSQAGFEGDEVSRQAEPVGLKKVSLKFSPPIGFNAKLYPQQLGPYVAPSA